MIKHNVIILKLIFISNILLVGCNDDSDSPENNSPTIEYDNTVSKDNNLENYTNADWLYQNYLGEYGLPDELKSMFMTELKMLANGFALQHSRGEDVGAAMSQFNTAMQMMYYSGELGSSIQQVLIEHEDEIYANPTEKSTPNISPDQHVEIIISAESQENIDKANHIRELYRKKQAQLVIDHNLPYALPEREIKYINYNQAQTKTREVGVGKKEHRGIDDWDWWEADIISTDGAYGAGHMGLVVDVERGELQSVIDAHKDGGVQKHTGLSRWANEANRQRVEGWRYGLWGEDHRNRLSASESAKRRVGSEYSISFLNKTATDKSYCSQLVWGSYYLQTDYDPNGLYSGPVGSSWENRVDLDHNGGLIVWPNDILDHINVVMFEASVPEYESYKTVIVNTPVGNPFQ